MYEGGPDRHPPVGREPVVTWGLGAGVGACGLPPGAGA